jgi:hypothetical protein
MVWMRTSSRICALAIAITAVPAWGHASAPVPPGCTIATTGAPGFATSCSFVSAGLPTRYVAAASGWDIQVNGTIVVSSGAETPEATQFSVKTGVINPRPGALVRLAIHKADRPITYQDGVLSTFASAVDDDEPATVRLIGLSDALYTPGDTRWGGQLQLEIWRGQGLRVTSQSTTTHSLRSDWPVPPFDSGDIGAGATIDIAGASSLTPNVYPFSCRFYPTMRGLLKVIAD